MIKATKSVTQTEIEYLACRSKKDSNKLVEKTLINININSDPLDQYKYKLRSKEKVLRSNVAVNRSENFNKSK
jgi:hypothetical protein